MPKSPPRDWESLWTLYPQKKALFQTRMACPPFEPALLELRIDPDAITTRTSLTAIREKALQQTGS
jgi:hypothetical protein